MKIIFGVRSLGLYRFLKVASLIFFDIAQDCSLEQCLISSRAETFRKKLCGSNWIQNGLFYSNVFFIIYITCRIYRTSKKKSARDTKRIMSIKRIQLQTGMRKQDWRLVTLRNRYYLLVIVILEWKRSTVERSANRTGNNAYWEASGQTSRTKRST